MQWCPIGVLWCVTVNYGRFEHYKAYARIIAENFDEQWRLWISEIRNLQSRGEKRYIQCIDVSTVFWGTKIRVICSENFQAAGLLQDMLVSHSTLNKWNPQSIDRQMAKNAAVTGALISHLCFMMRYSQLRPLWPFLSTSVNVRQVGEPWRLLNQ